MELQKSLQLHVPSGVLGSFGSEQHHYNDDMLHSSEAAHRETTKKTRSKQNPEDMLPPVDLRKLEQTQRLRASAEYQQRMDDQHHLDDQQYLHEQQQHGDEFGEHFQHHQDEVVAEPTDDDLSVEELKERIMLLKEQVCIGT